MPLSKVTLTFLHDTLRCLLKLNETPQGQKPVPLQEEEICRVVDLAIQEFKKTAAEGCLLELEAPLTVVGDTHGQFNDVIRMFNCNGWPPRTRYLFLGDYVDRGKQCIETMVLMFIFRIRYPDKFFILRGNHECPSISRIYGFYSKCKKRYHTRIWNQFQTAFSYMPICALISNKIFCTHGGLSPSLLTFDQLRKKPLPFEVPENTSLITDLLWSDPDKSVEGFKESRRGVSYLFGEDAVKDFCKKFGVELVIRGHQVVEKGYEFFADNKLATIFSAPHYCGEFDNCAATMVISETLSCKVRQLRPVRHQ